MNGRELDPRARAIPPHGADLDRLLDELPAAAFTCDEQGLITSFNPRAVELLGRAPALNDPVDRFCGSSKFFAVDGEPIEHARGWTALALQVGAECNGHEILVERPDGRRRNALVLATPLHDENGRIRGAVSVLIDISERRRAEAFAANRRRNEFLATLAHELRNPLAPLRNGLHVIQLAHDDATVENARVMMERQLVHMVRLIDDLLDLSRIASGKMDLKLERIDLSLPVLDAVATARPLVAAAGHRLETKLPQKQIPVLADRGRLAQVFGNLLDNSVKYTERGGLIELSVELEGSDVLVKVSDDGIGIAAQALPDIFEMFAKADRPFDGSRGGLGIGLSLVHRLTEIHGGSVEARSDGPGRGSEFVVRLPLALSSSAPEAPKGRDGESAHRAKYRILVVDDNKDAAVSLGMILGYMGHETRLAHDGLEAVECAREFRPEIVLLDIGLPKLNGYDACRQIREEAGERDIVLIALTGWGQEEDKALSREAGFHFHMVKPVDPAALEKLLDELLVTPS